MFDNIVTTGGKVEKTSGLSEQCVKRNIVEPPLLYKFAAIQDHCVIRYLVYIKVFGAARGSSFFVSTVRSPLPPIFILLHAELYHIQTCCCDIELWEKDGVGIFEEYC